MWTTAQFALHRDYNVNNDVWLKGDIGRQRGAGALQFQDLLSPTPLMNIEIVSRFIAGER